MFGVSSEGRLMMAGVGLVWGVDGYFRLTLFGFMSLYPCMVWIYLDAL